MHKKSWRQGKCISNLIRFFIFFKGNFFFYFQHGIIFLQQLFIPNMLVFFFCQFSFNTQKIFFSNKTDMTLIFWFFVFSFFSIQNKTLSYYEKGTEWKNPFFCIFFKDSKHIFLVLTKVKFLGLNHVMQFIDTNRRTSFFIFFL